MLQGTLTGTNAALSRQSLIGELCASCRQVHEAKFLGKWLYDLDRAGNDQLGIPIVETCEGKKAIIVYPGSDLSYGGPISKEGIFHTLDGTAKKFGLSEILFYSSEGTLGLRFLAVGKGDSVELTTSDIRDLSGTVVQVI